VAHRDKLPIFPKVRDGRESNASQRTPSQLTQGYNITALAGAAVIHGTNENKSGSIMGLRREVNHSLAIKAKIMSLSKLLFAG
jgi:hypothetical protein